MPITPERDDDGLDTEVDYLTFPSNVDDESEEVNDQPVEYNFPAPGQPLTLEDLEQLAIANWGPFLEQNYPSYPPEMASDFDPINRTLNPAVLRAPSPSSGIDPDVDERMRVLQQNGTLFRTMNNAATVAHETKKAMEAANLAYPNQMMADQNDDHFSNKPSKVPELPENHTPEELQAYNQAVFDEAYNEIMDDINNNAMFRAQREARPTDHVTGMSSQKAGNLRNAAFKPGALDVFMGAPSMAVNPDLSDPTHDDIVYGHPSGQGTRLESDAQPGYGNGRPTAAASKAPRRAAVPSNTSSAFRRRGGNADRYAGPVGDNVFATRGQELDTSIENAGAFFETEFDRVMAAHDYDSDRDLQAAAAPWAARNLGWLAGNSLNDTAQIAMENTRHHPEMNMRGPAANLNSGAFFGQSVDSTLEDDDRIPAESAIMDHRDHPHRLHVAAINRGRQIVDLAGSDNGSALDGDYDNAMDIDIPATGRDQPQTPRGSALRAHQPNLITPTRGYGGQPQDSQGLTTPAQSRMLDHPGSSVSPTGGRGRGALPRKSAGARTTPGSQQARQPRVPASPSAIHPEAWFPSYNNVPVRPHDTEMWPSQAASRELLQDIDIRPSTDFTRNHPDMARLPLHLPIPAGSAPVSAPAAATTTSPDDGHAAQQVTFAPAQPVATAPASSELADTATSDAGQTVTGRRRTAGVAGLSPPPSRPGTSAGALK